MDLPNFVSNKTQSSPPTSRPTPTALPSVPLTAGPIIKHTFPQVHQTPWEGTALPASIPAGSSHPVLSLASGHADGISVTPEVAAGVGPRLPQLHPDPQWDRLVSDTVWAVGRGFGEIKHTRHVY